MFWVEFYDCLPSEPISTVTLVLKQLESLGFCYPCLSCHRLNRPGGGGVEISFLYLNFLSGNFPNFDRYSNKAHVSGVYARVVLCRCVCARPYNVHISAYISAGFWRVFAPVFCRFLLQCRYWKKIFFKYKDKNWNKLLNFERLPKLSWFCGFIWDEIQICRLKNKRRLRKFN